MIGKRGRPSSVSSCFNRFSRLALGATRSTQDNKNLVLRYMEEGVNQGNVGIAGQVFASNFIFHFPGSPQPLEVEGWKQTMALFRSGFPQQKTTVDEVLVEGDKAAARFT